MLAHQGRTKKLPPSSLKALEYILQTTLLFPSSVNSKHITTLIFHYISPKQLCSYVTNTANSQITFAMVLSYLPYYAGTLLEHNVPFLRGRVHLLWSILTTYVFESVVLALDSSSNVLKIFVSNPFSTYTYSYIVQFGNTFGITYLFDAASQCQFVIISSSELKVCGNHN